MSAKWWPFCCSHNMFMKSALNVGISNSLRLYSHHTNSTQWGQVVMYSCLHKLSHHLFRQWLVTCLVPSLYLNHCWLTVNHYDLNSRTAIGYMIIGTEQLLATAVKDHALWNQSWKKNKYIEKKSSFRQCRIFNTDYIRKYDEFWNKYAYHDPAFSNCHNHWRYLFMLFVYIMPQQLAVSVKWLSIMIMSALTLERWSWAKRT